MARAVRDFLRAAGVDPARVPHVRETPERVARSWSDEFLDGYRMDPARLLSESFDAEDDPPRPGASGLVLVRNVSFHGLCPHHLLPYYGTAHIGYVPGPRLAPLGRLVRLLDAFAHRLEVQETVTRQIGEALVEHLGAQGAATVLDCEQTCVSLRGVRRLGARTVTRHFAGVFARREELRREFLESLGADA